MHARIWKPGKAAASGGGAVELVVGERGMGALWLLPSRTVWMTIASVVDTSKRASANCAAAQIWKSNELSGVA